MNSDMNEQMLEEMAEDRGYDRGFTAATKFCHDLVDQLKQESNNSDLPISSKASNSHILELAKLIIRKGYTDDNNL